MTRKVRIFIIPADRVPAGPPDPPMSMEVEASQMDELLKIVHQRAVSEGYRVRAVSFSPGGLVAYVEALQ